LERNAGGRAFLDYHHDVGFGGIGESENTMNMSGQKQGVLVLGLGLSGLSALRWLHAQGVAVSAADSRDNPPALATLRAEMPQVPVVLGEWPDSLFDDVAMVVISPGLSMQIPALQAAIQRGVEVVGDVELFARARSADSKVIGITGSNGKSTVTSMVGEVCQAAGYRTVVAGNIGLPVLDTLAQATDVYVLELSSYQLETTHSLELDAATMLNLSEDHLDRYGNMPAYAAAKQRIFKHCHYQVLNRDDSYSMAMQAHGMAAVSFGMDAPQNAQDYGLREQAGTWLLCRGEQALMRMDELKVAGLHNALNALATFALCAAIGIDDKHIVAALKCFKGLPHRVEWVAKVADVDFYDDSKGTNVGATCAALQGFSASKGKVVLIAGGDGKGQDFSPLRQPVLQSARAVVLIGRDAALIAKALTAEVPQQHADDLPQAVQQAFELAQAGDRVLLSPACASFDMFKDYQHRAEVFIQSVQQLAAQHKETLV
jgi:UDP-N-acetylmuramoylalanine--D-glutamate ligase